MGILEILEGETKIEQHGLYGRLVQWEDSRYAVEVAVARRAGDDHDKEWHMNQADISDAGLSFHSSSISDLSSISMQTVRSTVISCDGEALDYAADAAQNGEFDVEIALLDEEAESR